MPETRARWFPAPALQAVPGKWGDGYAVRYTSPEVPDGLIQVAFTAAKAPPRWDGADQFRVMMATTWSVPSQQWGSKDVMEVGLPDDLGATKDVALHFASTLLNGLELEPLPRLPSGAHALDWDGRPFTQRWL